MESEKLPEDLVQLVLDHIETVPHIEALVLLHETQPRAWSEEGVAERLYKSPEVARVILRDLHRKGLLMATADSPPQYALSQTPEARAAVERITDFYRHNVYRVATMIHSRPSQAVREFARAFDFKGKK